MIWPIVIVYYGKTRLSDKPLKLTYSNKELRKVPALCGNIDILTNNTEFIAGHQMFCCTINGFKVQWRVIGK
jgi:hypothetical protein